MNELTLFDYGQLGMETRIVVQQRTEEIKVLVRKSAQDIIDIGNKLIDVKERLGHGNFGRWLESEFGWSDQTARQFIHVATKFKNFLNLGDIGASALYLLAAPSTPEPARIEAIERAQAGEEITYTAAKAIVAQHRPAEPPRREFQSTTPAPRPLTDEEAVEAESTEIDGDEYYTPPYIIEAARQVLRAIDLDPASSPLAQTVVKAKRYYTKEDDGLTKDWIGAIWLNPPYSRPAPFVSKLISEHDDGHVTAAIVLVNTGTETQWGQSLLTRYPVCFVGAHGERRSRISFWRDDPAQPDNRNRYSQMIFFLGEQTERFVSVFRQFGAILEARC